jgi:mannose-6-phosphate isomerase-like protein (cupin superfamily)
VVTGHDAQGRSVFVADEMLEPGRARALPGWEFLAVWGGDETPVWPDDGAEPEWTAYFPRPGGFRFSFSTVPPAGLEPPPDLDPDEGAAEIERLLPGLLEHMEPDDPGMHTTDTIDLEVILSGEVIIELDDGAERLLRPGDTVVQNGTRHRWRNPGPEPCLMAIFMVGARRRKDRQRAP